MQTPSAIGLVGIIGLGLMGTALARRLMAQGLRVRVWNRTPDKARSLIAGGAEWTDHPLRDCERVVISLYTSGVVTEVLEGMRPDWRPGCLVIDTTTGEPGEVEQLGARLTESGIGYLDAPISGSSAQLLRGEATTLVGGSRDEFERCQDLWKALGGSVLHCGPVGSASRMKLITNLVLGLNRAALAEGLAFAEAIGVDPGMALEVMKASMAYSRAMDVKGRKMVERDFTAQARLSQHLKDVRLMLDAGTAAGLDLPLTQAHRRWLEAAEAAGLGELDNSVLIEVLRRRPEGTGTTS